MLSVVPQSLDAVLGGVILAAYPTQLLRPLTLPLVMAERLAAVALDRLWYKAVADEDSSPT